MLNAEIIADRFHVMKLLNNELDEARKKEKARIEKIKSKSKKERMQGAISKGKYVFWEHPSLELSRNA